MGEKTAVVEATPNPQPFCQIEDANQATTIRRLHCRRYDDCLDAAIEVRWPGFTCRGCAAFVPLTPTGEERDHRGLLELAAETIVANDNARKRPA